ncbi:MAG: radical SAM protein [archaeon]
MKKVLLIFTGHSENKPQMPFSVVVIAAYLRERNIPVEILDTRIDSYENVNYNQYQLIGISAKTGEQLLSAVEVCKHIRSKTKVPIVFGGPHATFFPRQTCKSSLTDFVVVGEGEETLYELVMALKGDKNYGNIKGLVFKDGENIVSCPDREFLDMKTLPLPAYDLVDMDKYQDKFQSFTIETSRGCPHRCSFCYVHEFHRLKWRVKSLQQVIKEMKYAIRTFGARKFFIADDNFFVSKKRVLDFSQLVVDEKLDIEILAYARANYFANFNDEEMELLRKVGFRYIGIGAESGSQRVLDLIKKDITCRDIENATRMCTKHGMIPVYSFVIGTPGEKIEDLHKTIDMYFKIKKISSKAQISSFHMFTPYPGTPIYHEAIKLGYKPHTTLEGWSTWNFSDFTNLPWLKLGYKLRLQVLSRIILFMFVRDRLNSYGKSFKRKKIKTWYYQLIWDVGSRLMYWDAMFRLKHKFFYFGYVWLIFGKIALKFKVT